jgi:hypothetical protein
MVSEIRQSARPIPSATKYWANVTRKSHSKLIHYSSLLYNSLQRQSIHNRHKLFWYYNAIFSQVMNDTSNPSHQVCAKSLEPFERLQLKERQDTHDNSSPWSRIAFFVDDKQIIIAASQLPSLREVWLRCALARNVGRRDTHTLRKKSANP